MGMYEKKKMFEVEIVRDWYYHRSGNYVTVRDTEDLLKLLKREEKEKTNEDSTWTEDEAVLFLLQVREEIIEFSKEMERVLRRNDRKSGWEDLSIDELFYLIKGKFEEMQQEFTLYDRCADTNQNTRIRRIREEAIDIANYCMFLCHNYTAEGEVR